MKTFEERCTELIVKRISRYRVVPRYIEGKMLDFVRPSRYGEGFDHNLEFQCIMDKERLKPETDLLQGVESEADMSERYISDISKKIEDYTVIKSNYAIANLGKALAMKKMEYSGPKLKLFGEK